jgi:Zn2+/Cd2+-exporting ATPase
VVAYDSYAVAKGDRPIDESKISNYTEIAAYGIQATIRHSRGSANEGKLVLAGNDRLMHRENIAHDTCNVEGKVVHLAVDGICAGYIIIADEIKEDAAQAIRALKAAGVERVMMLTGDSQAVAKRMAKTLGVDAFAAELLPEDKVAAIFNATRVLK